MTYWQALVLAIVEGLTEFLPVSSTGHMIIAAQLLGVAPTAFTKLFLVGIQFGAILSVLVVYYKRFAQSFRPAAAGDAAAPLGPRLVSRFDFYLKLLVAFVPIAVAGLLLKHYINELLESVRTVAVALLLGGVVLVFIDKLFPQEDAQAGGHPVTTPSFREAFIIGLFQCLALVPGVSRSAATIIGGLSQKLTRRSAAEFAFFLTVPTMGAATVKELYDYVKELHAQGVGFGQVFAGREVVLLLLGNAVAFVVALLVLKPFVGFVAKYGFRAFGIYRVVVGGLLLLLLGLGVKLQLV